MVRSKENRNCSTIFREILEYIKIGLANFELLYWFIKTERGLKGAILTDVPQECESA
jgi:hypothetical protein